jgi:hypothetical protein
MAVARKSRLYLLKSLYVVEVVDPGRTQKHDSHARQGPTEMQELGPSARFLPVGLKK